MSRSPFPRAAYADMFGPTVGDRVRLADTELIIEVERDLTILRRGGEVRRRQGDPRRHGPEPGRRSAAGAVDTVITNAVIIDHWGHRARPTSACRTAASSPSARPAIPTSSPASTIVIGPGTEIIAGEGKILTAGGIDAHIHFICPQQIEEALMPRASPPCSAAAPARRPAPTPPPARPAPGIIARMLQAAEGLPINVGLAGKGNASLARGAGRADRGRRLRAEAARGLGHHAGGDRLLPVGRRRVRRPGDDPHRHAERVRLRRGHDRRLQGPHHPRLPHRGRRRRPCAGHHQGGGPAPTSSRPRPIRPGPSPSTRSTSISTC